MYELIRELLLGPRDANRNVRAIFIMAIFGSIGFGMLWGSIQSIFILTLVDDSTIMLGLVIMTGGISQIFLLFPSAYIADRWRRDILVWTGSILGIIGIFILSLSINLEMLILAQIFLGISWGLSGTAIEALLADSTPSGTRSKVYSSIFFLRFGFSAVGPAINVFLFLVLGDNWGIDILRIVVMIAAIIITISAFASFFISDKLALGKESESLVSKDLAHPEQERSSFAIPVFIVGLGLIIGFGAGMTVAFFPVFFKEEYGLKPIFVNVIYFFMQILTGIIGILAQKVSKRLGLIETMFFLQMSAIYALAFITQYPPILFLIPLFWIRNALMNSSGPLNRTIVMDRIAKRHRAKWNALEQLAWGLFWTVSAAVGGWLIESYGFVVCFTITATLYMIATLPLLLLFGRVAPEGTREQSIMSVTKQETAITAEQPSTPSSLD